MPPIPSQDGGNNSVILNGKIPDKDIPAIQEVVKNAVKNTSEGDICHDYLLLCTLYIGVNIIG
jgi:hypothetical protein